MIFNRKSQFVQVQVCAIQYYSNIVIGQWFLHSKYNLIMRAQTHYANAGNEGGFFGLLESGCERDPLELLLHPCARVHANFIWQFVIEIFCTTNELQNKLRTNNSKRGKGNWGREIPFMSQFTRPVCLAFQLGNSPQYLMPIYVVCSLVLHIRRSSD